ncbi:MAG: DUF4396 domain-containing protein [Brevibacterium sp.]|uniref:DUF4396 domain-containing protein n=1 Tax=Brevibacterium sandarakinum TaxID=629680 RepID=UPI00264FD201|nr:DUF4396 domain-containing protein [Brevibacterium sandarakinum]MDN5585020.1 DUF4396 domain-containing protein [Brevibacterium sp.]MDN5657513.1 DUF4396 domain-containing protein [Brevibacterium sandarakinum]
MIGAPLVFLTGIVIAGWMALVSLVFFASPPEPDSPVFWLMMQIAMMLGFLTSFPANWILVRKGVKHAM